MKKAKHKKTKKQSASVVQDSSHSMRSVKMKSVLAGAIAAAADYFWFRFSSQQR